jgi:hypothetical protein
VARIFSLFYPLPFGSNRLERDVAFLTFETELNGDSKNTNERGPSLVGSLGS